MESFGKLLQGLDAKLKPLAGIFLECISDTPERDHEGDSVD